MAGIVCLAGVHPVAQEVEVRTAQLVADAHGEEGGGVTIGVENAEELPADKVVHLGCAPPDALDVLVVAHHPAVDPDQLGGEKETEFVRGVEGGLRGRPGVTADLVRAFGFDDGEDGEPGGFVGGGVTGEGEVAVLGVAPDEEGRAIEVEAVALPLEGTEAHALAELVPLPRHHEGVEIGGFGAPRFDVGSAEAELGFPGFDGEALGGLAFKGGGDFACRHARRQEER